MTQQPPSPDSDTHFHSVAASFSPSQRCSLLLTFTTTQQHHSHFRNDTATPSHLRSDTATPSHIHWSPSHIHSDTAASFTPSQRHHSPLLTITAVLQLPLLPQRQLQSLLFTFTATLQPLLTFTTTAPFTPTATPQPPCHLPNGTAASFTPTSDTSPSQRCSLLLTFKATPQPLLTFTTTKQHPFHLHNDTAAPFAPSRRHRNPFSPSQHPFQLHAAPFAPSQRHRKPPTFTTTPQPPSHLHSDTANPRPSQRHRSLLRTFTAALQTRDLHNDTAASFAPSQRHRSFSVLCHSLTKFNSSTSPRLNSRNLCTTQYVLDLICGKMQRFDRSGVFRDVCFVEKRHNEVGWKNQRKKDCKATVQ
jgi:hypothetical protein